MITLSYLAGQTLQFIEFDATLREEHAGVTTVTEHNVETGANISDHARPELRKITFDVTVTNTPIKAPTTNTDGVTGSVSATQVDVATRVNLPRILPGIGLAEAIAGNEVLNQTVVREIQVLNFDAPLNRVRSVYDDLEKLRVESTLVTIDSSLQQYTSMVIKTVTATRGPADGSSITYAVTATEIRFVDSKIVAVKADPGASKTSKGPQPGKKVDEPLRSTIKATGIKAGLTTATARPLAPLP